jgi:hypothetical protein
MSEAVYVQQPSCGYAASSQQQAALRRELLWNVSGTNIVGFNDSGGQEMDVRDLAIAARVLRKSPVFALTAALQGAMNTAVQPFVVPPRKCRGNTISGKHWLDSHILCASVTPESPSLTLAGRY